MNIYFSQETNRYKSYISYATNVKDIALAPPISFYNYDANDLVIIEKKGQTISVISSYRDVSKDVESAFDVSIIPDEDDVYLADYKRNVIVDRKSKYISRPNVSYLPPKPDNLNDIFCFGREKGWYKFYAKSTSLITAVVSLDFIDFITPNESEVKPTTFGVGLICDLIAHQHDYTSISTYDLKDVMAYIKPLYRSQSYDVSQLSQFFFHQLNENKNISSAQLAMMTLDGEIDNENKRVGRRKDKKFKPLRLSKFAELGFIPSYSKEMDVQMDVIIRGIDKITILPGKRVRVRYDPYLIDQDDIFDMFDNIKDRSLEDFVFVTTRNQNKED